MSKSKHGRNHSNGKPVSRGTLFETLEPRLLLSADALGAALPGALDPEQTPDAVVSVVDAETAAAIDDLFSTDSFSDPGAETAYASELIIIDTSVEEYDSLIAGLDELDRRRFDVALIDSSRDGLAQLDEILSDRQDLDAVHLITHGSDGRIQIGDGSIDRTTLETNADVIADWAAAFSEHGDFLIYGCNLAATVEGETFVATLSALTGADVAASDDTTGDAALGGDWDLELAEGSIETAVAIGTETQRNWSGVLAGDISSNLVMHLSLDDGAGSSASDSTANGNDGNLVGSPSWVSGEVAGGVDVNYLDGEDYIEIPNSASLENVQEGDFSLAAWFRPDSTPPGTGSDSDANYGIIIKTGWHNGLYYDNSNHFNFAHVVTGDTTVSVASTNTFAPGQFYHVAGVLDRAAGTISIYIDGQFEGSASFAPGTAAREYGTTTWKLGVANPGGGPWGWAADGAIDEARIYGRALTQPDISALHTLETTTFRTGVNGYTGTQDTELRESATTTSYGSETSVAVDLDSGGFESQGLIRFDNIFGNGAGQIPFGSTINSASLTVEDFDPSVLGANITLHKMLGTWDVSSTWDDLGGGLDSGADYTTATSSTLPSPETTGTKVFAGLAADLQSWSDGGANYGWAIISDNTNGWDFYTSEYGTSGSRPLLTVNYTAPLSGDISLLLSTDANVGNPGADGLSSGWTEGQVLNFAGPDLAHGATTDGDLSSFADFDTFTQNAVDVGALHFVSRDITVGGTNGTFDLKAGDVLVSFLQDETILAAYASTASDMLVSEKSLLVFRPSSFDNYSSGTFTILLDNIVTDDLKGVTLVEQDTTIGGTDVSAGSFLIIAEASATTSVDLFVPTGVGVGSTSGAVTPLIDISNLGVDANRLRGIELIENATTQLGCDPLTE